MSSYDSGQNEHSAQDENPPSKRRRIALACRDCRRRKLKCDRVYPTCTRCQKGSHPEACTYDADAVELVALPMETLRNHTLRDTTAPDHRPKPPATPNSFVQHHGFDTDDSTIGRLQTHIHQLENRIIGLERNLNGTRQWPGSNGRQDSARANVSHELEPEDDELMMFRGTTFQTQFYGATHHTSCLSHLPVLRVFMKDMILHHPRLSQVQKELKMAKMKTDEYGDGPIVDDKGLVALLPSREVADQLVKIYVDSFESTYRLLHLPSFRQEYSNLWEAPEKGRPGFIVLLLLILAAANCLRDGEQQLFRGDSSLGREGAIVWIRACDSWVRVQSQKHTTRTIFQILCLSHIAKQMNSIKRKRAWTSAGTLVRMAMAAGLHRDAEIVNLRHGTLASRKVSVFDQEMRRRIWATISELELQTSFDRGMPAMSKDLIIDCGPPLNVDDDQIAPSMTQPPRSRPVSTYTKSSFQHVLHSTWPLRLELLSLFNGPNPQLAYEDVLLYDKKISQSLDDIPDWESEKASMPKMLLQLQLQQLSLLLHRPYVRHEHRNSRYDYSAVVHLRAAMAILDIHHKMASTGTVFSVFRNDILSAALNIYYNLSTAEPNSDSKLSTWSSVSNTSNLTAYLEKALAMLEDKIMRVGVGAQEYYCVCASISLQKKQSSEPSRDQVGSEEYQAADRISKMIQRMLSLQDNFSAAATLASLPNMPAGPHNGPLSNGNGISPPVHVDGEILPVSFNNGTDVGQEKEKGLNQQDFSTDFAPFDLTNLSSWDLDAFFTL